jgi:hypothetical protein
MRKKGKLRRVTERATGPSTLHETMTSPHPDVTPTPRTAHLSYNATMSDVALWCLIEGDSMPFEVTAPVNANINRLKEVVREKGKNGVLGNVDAKDLVLLKVSAS